VHCTSRGRVSFGPQARPKACRVGGWRRRAVSPRALFTGIVQGLSEVRKMERKPDDFLTLTMGFPPEAKMDNISMGASVAINGTCLTVRERHIRVRRWRYHLRDGGAKRNTRRTTPVGTLRHLPSLPRRVRREALS
jgi:hypothetical protein